MYVDSTQFYVAFVAIFVAVCASSVLVFQRQTPRTLTRKWGTIVLCVCAAVAVVAWTRFGDLHAIYVDAPDAQAGQPHRRKIEKHQAFHFHEFFHYYLGAKYFGSFGYEGLYDCTALADKENADEIGVKPHVTSGWVRDLDDVLRDKSYDEALDHCRNDIKAHMSPARWDTFRADLRELQRLVPDDWWNDVVYDAGFNPPPSWCIVGGAIANIIPIRLFGFPSYLVSTWLDMVLLVTCFVALRTRFGLAAAATAGVYFGASFIASYGWNGGAFLRYTWVTAVVMGIAFARDGKWALAGAFFGAAACDRLFPAGFAVGAAIPLAWRAFMEKSPDDRKRLLRFGMGFGGAIVALVLVSTVVYGIGSWRVFFMRILRHGDVYYTMHIGLKKVITWRDWVPSQNFHGHQGLQRFHDWNMRLHATWQEMRWLAVAVQLVAGVGAAAACIKRRPYEASLILGSVAMFCFSLPANYYYVVLALVPALLVRAAMTSPGLVGRLRDWGVLMAFALFWLSTLLAPRMFGDDIVYDHFICCALLAFYGVWIAAWMPWQRLRQLVTKRSAHPSAAQA
jgi:hypothetical protein